VLLRVDYMPILCTKSCCYQTRILESFENVLDVRFLRHSVDECSLLAQFMSDTHSPLMLNEGAKKVSQIQCGNASSDGEDTS